MRLDGRAAEARWKAALPLYEQVGDRLGIANCFQSLGDLAYRGSDAVTAQTRWTEALRLYDLAGNTLGRANCIQSFGDLALDAGDEAEAERRYHEAIADFTRITEHIGLGNCAAGLARLSRRRERWEEARAYLEAARDHYRAAGHAHNLAIAEQELASLE